MLSTGVEGRKAHHEKQPVSIIVSNNYLFYSQPGNSSQSPSTRSQMRPASYTSPLCIKHEQHSSSLPWTGITGSIAALPHLSVQELGMTSKVMQLESVQGLYATAEKVLGYDLKKVVVFFPLDSQLDLS